MEQSFRQTFIGVIILASILFGNFSIFAQKRGGINDQTASNNQPKKECNSGYIGSVSMSEVGLIG